jgi:transcriptional regulator with XRE-family HTH domain
VATEKSGPPGDKKNPLGPTGQTVRENVKRLREERRMSYRELSATLAAAGRRIPALGLSRIEEGTRRVDADDLVALAVALGVNPSALLFPPTDDHEVSCQITGAGRYRASSVWDWADGVRPLVEDAWDEAEEVHFQLRARPRARRQLNPELFEAMKVLGEIKDRRDG